MTDAHISSMEKIDNRHNSGASPINLPEATTYSKFKNYDKESF